MEYSELIEKILTAEHNAQEIAKEAKEKKAALDDELKQESEQLRESYLERAHRRLEQVERQEAQEADAAMAELDRRQAAALAAVEDALAQNEASWVDTLFDMIVGDAK